MEKVAAFDYPKTVHVRKHGPMGYQDYESFRDWLRDEFSFRCVYCLKRELWEVRLASFHLDHFCPRVQDSSGLLVYDNLVYACATCNALKQNQVVPDPCAIPYGECLRVHEDGRIEALRKEGRLLIGLLRLDDDDHTRFRGLILKTLSFIRDVERDLFIQWMGYPEDLPNLRRKHVLGNSRPDGIDQSCYARRLRGELPDVY